MAANMAESFKRLNLGLDHSIYSSTGLSEVAIKRDLQSYINLSNILKKNKMSDNALQDEAKLIVSYWFNATKHITNLADEQMGLNVISSLTSLAKLPHSSKSFCVLCLVLLMKQNQFEKVQKCAYSAVPVICSTSTLFLLLMQVNKIYCKANNTSGWGRGIRTAACNWYKKWNPKMLALELSRYPGAYTWKHKDIIKMAHINNEKLPTGILLVIRNILYGFEHTKTNCSTEENDSDMLPLLEILNIEKNMCSNANKMVKRGKMIYKEFGSLVLQDFPLEVHNDPKVLDYILEIGTAHIIIQALIKTGLFDHCCSSQTTALKLAGLFIEDSYGTNIDSLDILIAYNVSRRKAIRKTENTQSTAGRWLNYPLPAEEKLSRANSLRIIDENSKTIIESLGIFLTKSTAKSKMTERSACVFIDNRLSMNSYIDISDERTGSKQITALQAALLTLVSLASNSRFDIVTPYAATPEGFVNLDNLPQPCPLHVLKTKMRQLESNSLLMIEQGIKTAKSSKKNTCIFLCFDVTKEIYEAAERSIALINLNSSQSEKLRVIICGMHFSEESNEKIISKRPDILIIQGFNRSSLPTIKQLHDFP